MASARDGDEAHGSPGPTHWPGDVNAVDPGALLVFFSANMTCHIMCLACVLPSYHYNICTRTTAHCHDDVGPDLVWSVRHCSNYTCV